LTFNDEVWSEKFGLLQFPKASKRERILDGYITIKLIKSELQHILWKEENMALVQLLKKVMLDLGALNLNIVESGENIMVQFHRDSLSTIKMEINKIIELKTLNLLMHLPIKDYIQIVSSEKENGGSYVQFVKNGNQSQKNSGILQEKGMYAITDVENAILESLLKIKEKEGEQSYSTHPTHKPVHLMAWLVRLVSKKGDIVLDPFIGSGTTAVACLRLNRKFIGIEKEEEYVKIAEARIKPYLEQKKLVEDLEEKQKMKILELKIEGRDDNTTK